ncbi:hypothetical protein NP233_g5862 [Leucocoprinus birnbaumii]|uniref:Nephrocystin 3-like N-terminal domain-containing protein n=1 Tax=Leucocoprinus birnbaumii TaxID=56174 RepID=A0AAD5VY67_9AGAR|nr:hypothetical protein NP233_g5862 [Leucocoprinus birnbaumii]
MLDGASNFVINNLSQTQVVINHWPLKGIDILYNETIHEAAHDSAARDPPPRCHPGTRTSDILHVLSWALTLDSDSPMPLLWVAGAAGVGKSALVQTCVELLRESNVPVVALFLSRSHGWNSHRQFFPTIAYQLSTYFPEYRALLNSRIIYDKSLIYHKSITSQFKSLILEPLQELKNARKGTGQRIPIFIDALDECDSIPAQLQIIELILAAAVASSSILCWAFCTRPEPRIEAAFSCSNARSLCHAMTLVPLPHLHREEADTTKRSAPVMILTGSPRPTNARSLKLSDRAFDATWHNSSTHPRGSIRLLRSVSTLSKLSGYTNPEDRPYSFIPPLTIQADIDFPFLWLYGAAGAGKSSLAPTCFEIIKERRLPLITFFFSRHHDPRVFVLTIAYQLSTRFSDYHTLLNTKILNDKSLLYYKTLTSQLKELVLEPLEQLEEIGNEIKRGIPIFVDGLDESDSIVAQNQILELTAISATCRTSLIRRWAIFIRPRPHIGEAFSRPSINTLCHQVFLPT